MILRHARSCISHRAASNQYCLRGNLSLRILNSQCTTPSLAQVNRTFFLFLVILFLSASFLDLDSLLEGFIPFLNICPKVSKQSPQAAIMPSMLLISCSRAVIRSLCWASSRLRSFTQVLVASASEKDLVTSFVVCKILPDASLYCCRLEDNGFVNLSLEHASPDRRSVNPDNFWNQC